MAKKKSHTKKKRKGGTKSSGGMFGSSGKGSGLGW